MQVIEKHCYNLTQSAPMYSNFVSFSQMTSTVHSKI